MALLFFINIIYNLYVYGARCYIIMLIDCLHEAQDNCFSNLIDHADTDMIYLAHVSSSFIEI